MKRLIKLQSLIREKFRTNYQAADRLKIADYQLSLFLNGRKRIPEEILLKLEKVLKCSRQEFLPEDYSNGEN